MSEEPYDRDRTDPRHPHNMEDEEQESEDRRRRKRVNEEQREYDEPCDAWPEGY